MLPSLQISSNIQYKWEALKILGLPTYKSRTFSSYKL